MVFMFVDLLGGVFSTLSLIFRPPLDPLLSFSYISVVVLDGMIIALKLILNPLAARRRARQGDLHLETAAEKEDINGSHSAGVKEGRSGDPESVADVGGVLPPRSIEAEDRAAHAEDSAVPRTELTM